MCSVRIVADEEIAEGTVAKGVPPASPAMFVGVVNHVAARAERGEVAPAPSAMGRIVVEVRGGEIDRAARHANIIERDEAGLGAQRSPASVAPGARFAVPPDSIRAGELGDVEAVRAAALLATPLRANEADEVGDLGPVDRVEPAMFGTDRHGAILNHAARERKGKIALAAPLGGIAADQSRVWKEIKKGEA